MFSFKFEIYTILAILLGPVSAVVVSKLMERSREKRERKLEVFRKLMRTRITPKSDEHLGAVNLIYIEFKGNRKILSALKEYINISQVKLPSNPSRKSKLHHDEQINKSFIVLAHIISKQIGYRLEQFEIDSDYFFNKRT